MRPQAREVCRCAAPDLGGVRPQRGTGLRRYVPTVRPKDCCGCNFPSQLDSRSVRHTALSLLAVILKRALKTVEHCLNREAWQDSRVYTATMMEDFVRLFREALSKVGRRPGWAFPSPGPRCGRTPSRCLRSAHQLGR